MQGRKGRKKYKKEKLLLTRTVSVTMSSTTATNKKNNFKDLNRDFEFLFNNAADDNIKKCLVAEITKEVRLFALKKSLKILLLIAFVITQIYMIPFLNWNATAIGRIVMIKMLKIWDWRYLYNVDCLIERKVTTFEDSQTPIDHIEDDCSFCENIGKNVFSVERFCQLSSIIDGIFFFSFFSEKIPHDWDISYADLKANYINRGHPVVIEDHQYLSLHSNVNDYIKTIKNLTDLIDSHPCNLQTNLVTSSQYTNLNELLDLTKISWDGWFIHFRNCDFSSVKASRALIGQPTFLTSLPKAFSASWILLSSSYNVTKPKKLLVKHLVVVKQIIGTIDVFIAPKSGCTDNCKDFFLRLEVGNTIVFSAEFWDFLYRPSSQGEASSFVREYELHI